jgi:hypothetical protein
MSYDFYAKSMMQCVMNNKFYLLFLMDERKVCLEDLMPPPGLEPGLPASEAGALSSELRGLAESGFFHSGEQMSNAVRHAQFIGLLWPTRDKDVRMFFWPGSCFIVLS